ncbi:hypothetical protein CKM354_000662700 [Cercospora kikuchii]|uniref:C2H2-type domain-containing protein n=1 Tax=Cercospora kikuchii TaxID=84275 RepID=A0A9P3CIC1_9PEZI|nr:uncharacterized protein CKM354_000662700 [Cercospora kikuchii]GIZ43399.1 hypothetical protein CKM354_000662700 [Cercospora kikuchii]
METASASFQCQSCPATYGKLEHLQRHNLSVHSDDRPFSCPFCSQAFARRDVLPDRRSATGPQEEVL